MQILQSSQPAFRYLWKFGPKPPAYLAATRVVVFDLQNDEFFARCDDSLGRIGNPDKAGGIQLREMSNPWMAEANRLIQGAIDSAQLAPFKLMGDYDPQLALALDTVSYHHDMPWWSAVLGAWCVKGPERVLHFPLMDLFVPFKPGVLVLFDPAQPHALLRPGQNSFTESEVALTDTEAEERIAFVSFMAGKEGSLSTLLDARQYDPEQHAHLRHTTPQYKACRITGAVQFEDQPVPA
jgi:hypothetical protein